jgi:hypothetical protein
MPWIKRMVSIEIMKNYEKYFNYLFLLKIHKVITLKMLIPAGNNLHCCPFSPCLGICKVSQKQVITLCNQHVESCRLMHLLDVAKMDVAKKDVANIYLIMYNACSGSVVLL